MATFSLPRFSRVDFLKSVDPTLLLRLLEPYRKFFRERGVNLPKPGSPGKVDFMGLVGVLMSPDEHMPDDLAEALYYIDEMATTDGMDALLEEVDWKELGLSSDCTAGDVAISVWLYDSDLLERKHAEACLIRIRAFEYFQCDDKGRPKSPFLANLTALQDDLDVWFEARHRGRGCRIFHFPRNREVSFLVRHGRLFCREDSLVDGEPTGVFYRPLRHDQLVYDPTIGELRIHAETKGEKSTYREKFGEHLFGDPNYFPGSEKYTLEPLRIDGANALVCSDVKGLKQVILKEIQYHWGGSHHEIEIRRANDLFAALESRNASIEQEPRLLRAKFSVQFKNVKKPRTVTVKPPNVALYIRESDRDLIELWLKKRGFILRGADAESS